MPGLIEWFAVVIVLGFFSYVSYNKKSLDKEGIIAGIIIGLITFILGGIELFLVMVAFFVIAESATRLARSKFGEKHGKRTTGNILGNAGAAMLALIICRLLLIVNPIAFFGSIATALADTVSSEIGLLSGSEPRLITRLRQKVPAGTDGGITLLGTAAGLAGALIISLIYYWMTSDIRVIWIITIAGFCGTLADSFLGALFERRKLLGNTSVNFLASGVGAVMAYALFILL